MPLRPRLPGEFEAKLDLPPVFHAVSLREAGDAFAHATANAAELGAGSFVFVGRFDLSEFAVVLEPDEPLATARRAFYAGMVALGDTLAAHAPPEKPIEFVWPDAMRVDGGIVGGGQFAWAKGAEDGVPDWLVFGAMIRTVSFKEGDAGLHPLNTALEEEGFDGLESGRLAESFSRHLMTTFDAWDEGGFGAVANRYLPRLIPEKGVSRTIDDNGDLIVRRVAKPNVERRALVAALASPSWLDPQTRGPR
jgi:hypothetical protein